MTKTKKLIIVGDSSFAEVAYEYFTHDSPYTVYGFSVERQYLKKNTLLGLPVIPFEDLVTQYNPDEYAIYVAIVYTQLNRLRARLYLQAKQWGYECASYISSQAFVWPNAIIGEHCFIFENNVIQPYVRLGDNVVLWSGNHIGHHSTIDDHCFIASHAVISGHCSIGKYSFLGVNTTVIDQIHVAQDNLLGAGALILRNTEPNQLYKGHSADLHKVSSKTYFKVSADMENFCEID